MKKILLIGIFATLFALSVRPAMAVNRPAWLNAVTGKNGEVDLYWAYADGLRDNSYNVSYGEGRIDQYGALRVGVSANIMMRYTVGQLKPGVKYCFAVSAVEGTMSSGYSPIACATAGGYGAVYQEPAQVLPETPRQAQPVQQPQPQVAQPKPVGASTQPKYQGTMEPKTGLNPAEITTGRLGLGKHNLRVVTGPNKGEITVYWNKNGYDNYHLVYTDEPGNWKYGVLNMGNTHTFTVGNMTSGVRYYFALVPVSGNQAGPHSAVVSEIAR